MKRLLLLIFMASFMFVAHGRVVNVDDALRFDPTDKYEELSVPGTVWAGSHKGGVSIVMMKTINADLTNETRNNYMNVMDTVVFNLKGAELLERVDEPWLDWTKDYLFKYYKTADGKNVVTYNFTSFYNPYSVLCLYETEEELADFIELTGCFQEPPLKGRVQLILVLKNAYICLALIALVLMAIATILARFMSRAGATFICMIGVAIFLLFPLKGLWLTYFLLLLAATIWSAICTGRWWDDI